jgi:hypothetical protein
MTPLLATKNLLSERDGTEVSTETQRFIGSNAFCPTVLLSLGVFPINQRQEFTPTLKGHKDIRCFSSIKALFLLGFLSKLLSGTEVGQKGQKFK